MKLQQEKLLNNVILLLDNLHYNNATYPHPHLCTKASWNFPTAISDRPLRVQIAFLDLYQHLGKVPYVIFLRKITEIT